MCRKAAPYGGMQNGSMVKKKKAEKVKPKIRWWKLKETSCQGAFRQETTRILGGKDGFSDEWDKTAEMLRKTAETVLGVAFGKRKGDRETWWWNEEVQESIKETKEAKKAMMLRKTAETVLGQNKR